MWRLLHYLESNDIKKSVDGFGQTTLHQAVPWCNFKVCKYSYASGMDMNIVDNHGKSPRSKVENGNVVNADKNQRKT